MGNREYIITQKEEPTYKIGDILPIYLGKGVWIDTTIKDIRLSNSGVWVIKSIKRIGSEHTIIK